MLARLFVEIITQRRRIVQQRLNIRILGIKNAQRVAVHATLAIFVKLVFMLFQERNQCITVVRTRFQGAN
ncbi:hypothetical protein D3C72_2285080 [compost metagenome]